MQKLSDQAWIKSQHIIHSIHKHPFNIELAEGSLNLKRFAYYIEQDSIYLQSFARCHAMIAARLPIQYMQTFLKYAEDALIAEQDLVHQHYRDHFHLEETGTITPATLGYTSYLQSVCAMQPVEVAIAAMLPCFWVYRDVGRAIADRRQSNHRYARWIDTYASKEFNQSVVEIINLTDKLASHANKTTQSQMIDAFYNSTVLEWHFWNDAYHLTAFDVVTTSQALTY